MPGTKVSVSPVKISKVSGSRIRITLNAGKSGIINFNYHHQLLGLIYNFLKSSDPDYSRWLHDEGYVVLSDVMMGNSLPVYRATDPPPFDKGGQGGFARSHKNFKLFCISGITFNCRVKAIREGLGSLKQYDDLRFSFEIASPVQQFIQHLVVGLFERADSIYIGNTSATIETVESLPDIQPNCHSDPTKCHSRESGNPAPPFSREASTSPPLKKGDTGGLSSTTDQPPFHKGEQGGFLTLKPLESPIFIKKPMPLGQPDKYLFPDVIPDTDPVSSDPFNKRHSSAGGNPAPPLPKGDTGGFAEVTEPVSSCNKEFAYYLNKNLKDKYFALFGEPCPYEDLEFNFHDSPPLPNTHVIPAAEPVSTPPFSKGDTGGLSSTTDQPPFHKEGQGGFSKKTPTEKVIEVRTKSGKSIKIKGTLKPFTVKGNPELIKIGLYCGFGANNSVGCGYVEVVDSD